MGQFVRTRDVVRAEASVDCGVVLRVVVIGTAAVVRPGASVPVVPVVPVVAVVVVRVVVLRTGAVVREGASVRVVVVLVVVVVRLVRGGGVVPVVRAAPAVVRCRVMRGKVVTVERT